MDELFRPIKTTLPSGLNILTMRTERKGLLGGEIRVDFGAAHAAKIDPDMLGLPHYLEHLKLYGASRKYGSGVAKDIMWDQFHTFHNAYTGLQETRYFTCVSEGNIFPVRSFWDAFALAADGLFFPLFDSASIELERSRILEELSKNMTQATIDEACYRKLLWGTDYLDFHPIGTEEQIKSYTFDDFASCHEKYYSLKNTTVTIVGDIQHNEAIERVSAILDGASTYTPILPFLEMGKIRQGEFRRFTDGANEGSLEMDLKFDASTINDKDCLATRIVTSGMHGAVSDKIIRRYGLYAAHAGYYSWVSSQQRGEINFHMETSRKETSSDVLAYALDLILSPQTHQTILNKHASIVDGFITAIETDQSTVQSNARYLNHLDAAGGAFKTPAEQIEDFRNTTPDQVAEVLKKFSTAPMFLNVRGHADALDAPPSIDIIDAWRAKPAQPDYAPVNSALPLPAPRPGERR